MAAWQSGMTMSDEPRDVDAEAASEAGYRKPPKAARFQKGRSGNPNGRPRNRRRGAPFEAVLGQIVTIRDGAAERRVTAEEAFLLHLTKRGLEGDGPAARAAMDAIETARLARQDSEDSMITFVTVYQTPGSANSALEPLGMVKKLDPYRPTARIAIEPWLVQAALARLGGRHLSRKEQECVVNATRMPHKVEWPAWWEVLP